MSSATSDVPKKRGRPRKDAQSSNTNAVMPDLPEIKQVGERMIDVTDIEVCSLNPRKTFDQKALQELADSLVRHGQIQNLSVRKVGKKYELLGGERRLRAANLANIPQLRCMVLECDDAAAVELRGVENYRREQLNAIEEAIWFQQMLETKRFNQSTLAKYLGITPGQVSNRLRLLGLPDHLQTSIAAGDLPPTHARSLLPIVERENVLADLEAAMAIKGLTFNDLTVSALDTMVVSSLLTFSRQIKQGYHNSPKFELTDDILVELDIDEVPCAGRDPEKRAFNIELWDKLQSEAKKVEKKSIDAKLKETIRRVSGGDRDPEIVSKLNDYELGRYFGKVFGCEIATHIKADFTAVRIFLTLFRNSDFSEFVTERLVEPGTDPEDVYQEGDSAFYSLLDFVSAKTFPAFAQNALSEAFADAEEVFDGHVSSSCRPHLSFLMVLAKKEVICHPLREWRADRALLERCSTVQLRTLFTEEMADLELMASWDREMLLDKLVEYWPAGYLPPLLTPQALLETDV